MTRTPRKTPKAAADADRAAARGELFRRLLADYPQLPVSAVVNAVTEADRAMWLCGHGDTERLTLEQACRHNLEAMAAALAGDSRYVSSS